MSTEYQVLDHHLDEDANVYRLHVGVPETGTRPKTDGDGNVILTQVTLADGDGNPQLDVDGREVKVWGPPEMEEFTHHPTVFDFVFAADDERWKGKSADEVAAEQRDEVKAALAKADKDRADADERRAQRVQLPGSGETL